MTIQVGGRLVRSEPLDSPLVVDACATPPPPVLAALNVPDGAGLDVVGKLPPFAEASATAEVSWLAAPVGTVDKRPMRDGSRDG